MTFYSFILILLSLLTIYYNGLELLKNNIFHLIIFSILYKVSCIIISVKQYCSLKILEIIHR